MKTYRELLADYIPEKAIPIIKIIGRNKNLHENNS